MEENNGLPEFDTNRASDNSHLSQQIEDEIKRVEQTLAYLEKMFVLGVVARALYT